jgi:diapolycopene oxygenase
MVRKKLEKSKLMYEKAGRIFLEKPLHKVSTWLSKDVFKSLAYIPSLGLLSTMHTANKKELKDPRLIQIFDRYATYNGSDPYRAPAALNIIPHLEHGIGTYLPENGMHEIATSILRLAKELGAEFHFEEKVEEIIIKNKRATGVKTKKGVYESDIVISNMDVTPTYRKLLKGQKAPERILGRERSSSALIFYWGIKKEFPELGLHNILFSNNYREEFRSIFNDNLPYHDPTVYITVSSKLVKSDAPEGCENWFVMINLSDNRGKDYEKLIPVYREIIIEKINRSLKTDITGLIDCETVLDPLNIELKTSSAGGSLYGSSSNSRFAAFMRHANESRRIKGLYFTGGSVHPGGGIPLCLLSAKITSELIDKE